MNIVAFGVSMPLSRFLAEVAPYFLFPMWPLLVVASALQIFYLVQRGVFIDGRAWKIGFAILLAPTLTVVLRVVLYVVPDFAPFANRESSSEYVLTLTRNTLISSGVAYLILSSCAHAQLWQVTRLEI